MQMQGCTCRIQGGNILWTTQH